MCFGLNEAKRERIWKLIEYVLIGIVEFDFVQKFWLDKRTGKICMSISSNGLAITGIDDRRYWSRIQTEESRWDSILCIYFCKLRWNWNWLFVDAYVLDWLIKSNCFWAFFDEIFQRKGYLLFIFFLPFCDALFLMFLLSVCWIVVLCMFCWDLNYEDGFIEFWNPII